VGCKVYKRAKFGDISIKGTAKEHEMKLQRQRSNGAMQKRQEPSLRSKLLGLQDCRGRFALLALYWTLSSDGHPSESGLYEKSGPGLSSLPSSACFAVAEAGSINSGESFFTFPTALSTFQAVILLAS
jgi:hypothetical protein